MKKTKVKFRRGFKTWAEKKSVEFRNSLNLKPWAPLSALELAIHLNVKVITQDKIVGLTTEHLFILNKGESWSAIKMKVGSSFLIIHNNNHHLNRQESNIMHELAHIICEHKTNQTPISHSFNLMLRDYNEEQENEAEYLGATLQLPRIALFYAKKDYGLDIKKIAEKFNASEVMVKYRLGVTGLLRK